MQYIAPVCPGNLSAIVPNKTVVSKYSLNFKRFLVFSLSHHLLVGLRLLWRQHRRPASIPMRRFCSPKMDIFELHFPSVHQHRVSYEPGKVKVFIFALCINEQLPTPPDSGHVQPQCISVQHECPSAQLPAAQLLGAFHTSLSFCHHNHFVSINVSSY
jgi:hypothetical protein